MMPIYAGTFDPITRGHCSVIERMVKIFGKGMVLLATNPDKQYTLTGEERQQLVQSSLKELGITTVGVSATFGYVCEWARQLFPNDAVLVRGMRGEGDLAYEVKIAEFNRKHGIDTVFLPAETGLYDISSSKYKKLITKDTWDGYELVPYCVHDLFSKKMYGK